MLTGLGNDSLATIHLHLVSAKQSSLDALIRQVQFQVVIIQNNIPNRLHGEQILEKTVEIAGVADVVKTNRKRKVDGCRSALCTGRS